MSWRGSLVCRESLQKSQGPVLAPSPEALEKPDREARRRACGTTHPASWPSRSLELSRFRVIDGLQRSKSVGAKSSRPRARIQLRFRASRSGVFQGDFRMERERRCRSFFYVLGQTREILRGRAGAPASASHRPSGSSPDARNDRIRKQETDFRDQNFVTYLRYFQLGALFAVDKKVHNLSISCILCTFLLTSKPTVW